MEIKQIGSLVLFVVWVLPGCGWERHALTPAARAVKISKVEPVSCEMVGAFDTYADCLNGPGTGNTNMAAQFECIKWKTNEQGGNYAVLDATVGDGYYKGRVFKCTAQLTDPAGQSYPRPATSE